MTLTGEKYPSGILQYAKETYNSEYQIAVREGYNGSYEQWVMYRFGKLVYLYVDAPNGTVINHRLDSKDVYAKAIVSGNVSQLIEFEIIDIHNIRILTPMGETERSRFTGVIHIEPIFNTL
jgi:hypothetical protein